MLLISLLLTLWTSPLEGSPGSFDHNVFLNKHNKDYIEVGSITNRPNINHNPFFNGRFNQMAQGSNYNPLGKDLDTLVRTNPFFANHIPNIDPRVKPSSGSIDGNPFLNNDKSEKTVPEVCGLSTMPLIVGGEVVRPGEYPWLGALFYIEDVSAPDNLLYICTVNLVTRQHVLTAAHCVTHDLDKDRYRIILGKLTKDKSNNVKIKGIESHAGYEDGKPSHDFAILALEDPVSFNHELRPICLWSSASESGRASRIGWVAGFGPDYTQCRKIKFPIVSQDRCRASHVDFHSTTSDYTFCAGTRDNKGPCFGDSGAGYMQNDTGRTHLRGVVSYSLGSNGNCNLREYIIFADVTKDLQWVREKLSGYL